METDSVFSFHLNRKCQSTWANTGKWCVLRLTNLRKLQCYRGIRIRMASVTLAPLFTLVHCFVTIFLDGATCTHVIKLWFRRQCVAARIKGWHCGGGTQIYSSVFLASPRWQDLRISTWGTLCHKPRQRRKLCTMGVGTLGGLPAWANPMGDRGKISFEYFLSTTKLTFNDLFLGNYDAGTSYIEISAKLTLVNKLWQVQ